MKKIFTFLVLIILFPIQILFSQTNNQPFRNDSINIKYLEHLVKTKIDSVRLVYNCGNLVNDSILYVASLHHSKYMLKNTELTHFEKGNNSYKTPQSRVEFYGWTNYQVGENVLKTYYNTEIKDKKGKIWNTDNYQSLADCIVSGWVYSPGHFKNMITPAYQITGVSIVYNKETKEVYSCQNFAFVTNKYYFTESKTFFPYSNYVPPEPITSFDQVPAKSSDCKHDWGVKDNNPEKCNRCSLLLMDNPLMTLRIENNSFILKIENSDYVKNFNA